MVILTGYKVWCGTYKKYNEYRNTGEWMDLCDYNDADEFYEACRELHSDEDDPEFGFFDTDCPFDIFEGEPDCSDIRRFYELKNQAESLDVDYDDDDVMFMLSKGIDIEDRVVYCGDEDGWNDHLDSWFEEGIPSNVRDHVLPFIDLEHVRETYGFDYTRYDLPSGDSVWIS